MIPQLRLQVAMNGLCEELVLLTSAGHVAILNDTKVNIGSPCKLYLRLPHPQTVHTTYSLEARVHKLARDDSTVCRL